jgi:3-hydroxybutyryl-CoA dehydratase
MHWSQQAELAMKSYADVQQKIWETWFGSLQPARRSIGNPWQHTLNAWETSFKTTLDAQAELSKLWTTYLATLSRPSQLTAASLRPVAPSSIEQPPVAIERPKIQWQFKVGDTASLSKKISEEDVVRYAEISGDCNPVHLDAVYAKQTRFGACIAHGLLAAGLISAVLGTLLPGPGAVYLSQNYKFARPVYIDDVVTAIVTVTKLRDDKPILTLATVCTNQRDEPVLDGEATILYEPVDSSL